MSEIVLKKKKKEPDFPNMRRLEDERDEAKDNFKEKENELIETVYHEYLDAEHKGEFFKQLRYSESWYRQKFQDHDPPLLPESGRKSELMSREHVVRKVQGVVDDLTEMEEIPIVEIDESLTSDTDYEDPREWARKTREELQGEEPRNIVEDSNFGKYQSTKTLLSKARNISKYDFDVGDDYRKILIFQLKKTISFYEKLLEELHED